MRRKGESVLASLGAFQRDLLRAPVVSQTTRGDEHHMDVVARLTRDHGFEPLGIGSTRVVIEVEADAGCFSNAVAKVAFDWRGLVHNIDEAAAWLGFPTRVRRHFAPCICIAPTFVVVQEHCVSISPPTLTGDARQDLEWRAETRAAAVRWHEAINEMRRALGAEEKKLSDGHRMQNYGVRESGELVALDYGHGVTAAPELTWHWVYERSAAGPVWLDPVARKRSQEGLERPTAYTPFSLCERAVGRVRSSDPCPCGDRRQFSACCKSREVLDGNWRAA